MKLHIDGRSVEMPAGATVLSLWTYDTFYYSGRNATWPIPWSRSADLFDPDSNSFTSALPATMTSGRSLHTATLLTDGRVLIAGGFSGSVVLSTAELFDYSGGSFASVSSMNMPRGYHTSTLLSNGKVLIAGGVPTTHTAELFDPGSGTFIPTLSTMTVARYTHTATLLSNGKVLLAGGLVDGAPTDAAELLESQSPALRRRTRTPSHQPAVIPASSLILPKILDDLS